MELNYIILAHKNPAQVSRLIAKLSGPECRFYVHVDRNVRINSFKELQKDKKVVLLKEKDREPGTWGDIGIVKATVNAMRQILAEGRNGYCVLLSGQDYPLRPQKNITKFFETHNGTSFISTFSLPHPNWKDGGYDRIEKYKINKSQNRKHFLQLPSIYDKDFYNKETAGKLNFLRKTGRSREIMLVFKKRRFPSYLKPYGGGQWWALPINKVKEILNFIEDHPDYLSYHTYTLLPDEIFFQSILITLEGPFLPSLTYVNWTRKNTPLPVTFVKEDLEELKQASKEKLFARKFDIDLDSTILDILDWELLG